MKTVIIIVAALAVFWIVFFVAPGIVAYFTVFSRRKTASFEEVAATEYFKPYIGAIGAAKKRLESLGGKKVRIKGYNDTELEGLFIDGGAKRTASSTICSLGSIGSKRTLQRMKFSFTGCRWAVQPPNMPRTDSIPSLLKAPFTTAVIRLSSRNFAMT